MIVQKIVIPSSVSAVENNMLVVRCGGVTDSYNTKYYRVAHEAGEMEGVKENDELHKDVGESAPHNDKRRRRKWNLFRLHRH